MTANVTAAGCLVGLWLLVMAAAAPDVWICRVAYYHERTGWEVYVTRSDAPRFEDIEPDFNDRLFINHCFQLGGALTLAEND